MQLVSLTILEVGERQRVRLSNGVDLEPNFPQLGVVQPVSAVEQEGWLGHAVVNLLVVVGTEDIPFGQQTQRMSSLTGSIRVLGGDNAFLQPRGVVGVDLACVIHLKEHILTLDLRVVDVNLGVLGQQVARDEHGWGLADIAGVALERISQDCDLLSRDSVEHLTDNLLREALLLEVVHQDDLVPVGCALVQSVGLAEVHQVENILLEARSSKSDGRVQESLSDTIVHTHGTRDLQDIRSSGLAKGRDGVDAGHALSQEGVGDQLGKLGRPQVGGQDLFTRDPVLIDTDQHLRSLESSLALLATNQDAVRLHQVSDSRSFRQELGVAQDLKVQPFVVRVQHTRNGLGRAHRDRTLLDDDLVALGDLGNGTSTQLAILNVGRTTSTDTLGLGGRVDTDEDNVGTLDLVGQVGREEEVLVAAALHDLQEARLVDGQVIGVPSINLLLGDVDNGNADLKGDVLARFSMGRNKIPRLRIGGAKRS